MATREPGEEPSEKASARSVDWSRDLPTVRTLFLGYRQWLADHRPPSPAEGASTHAGLAVIDRLIEALPGDYRPPRGDVLLWREGEEVVACGALRELEPKVGEIKRIYVRPDYRGKEFGPPFVRELIRRARELGWNRLRADTLPTMTAAIGFYHELGFRRIVAFWPHPVPDAIFFERAIGREDSG